MTHRFSQYVLVLTLTLPASAAMLRVSSVQDANTIVVIRANSLVPVRLGGVVITDEAGARQMLEWTLAGFWVMVDERPGTGSLVYRSPDGLLINRELVTRGYARSVSSEIEPEQHVTILYLGEFNPITSPPAKVEAPRSKAPPARKKVISPKPSSTGPKAPGSGTGKTRRPKARRSP